MQKVVRAVTKGFFFFVTDKFHKCKQLAKKKRKTETKTKTVKLTN